MLLIADSGSTKTDWCLVDDKREKKYFSSCGMNPYNISENTLKMEMENVVLPHINIDKLKSFYFYGAGCSSEVKQKEMMDIFSLYFPNTYIEINHDLLGAARASCGKEKGLVAILGTGSNSCLYDGEKILENVPALGYVLCDEGAGTNIGKLVLRNYLRHLMPKDLEDKFRSQYPEGESEFLNALYKGDMPNYYLASFAKFAIDNKNHQYCRDIIKLAFVSFFENQIILYSDYKSYNVNVIGSIGCIAKDIFEEVSAQFGVEVGGFIKAPLTKLVDYHA